MRLLKNMFLPLFGLFGLFVGPTLRLQKKVPASAWTFVEPVDTSIKPDLEAKPRFCHAEKPLCVAVNRPSLSRFHDYFMRILSPLL